MLQVTPMDAHGNFSFGPVCLPSGGYAGAGQDHHCGSQPEYALGLRPYRQRRSTSRTWTWSWKGENPAIAAMGAGAPPTRGGSQGGRDDRQGDPQRRLPAAGHRRYAQHRGLPDRGVRSEGSGRSHRDVCGRVSWTWPAPASITGRCKTLDKGRQVYAFAAGTQKLYDYIKENPDVHGRPCGLYQRRARSIAQLDNFISINNAVDMDLFGQVNAESCRPRSISPAPAASWTSLWAPISPRAARASSACPPP